MYADTMQAAKKVLTRVIEAVLEAIVLAVSIVLACVGSRSGKSVAA